jgi:hypothetical protein
MKMVESWEKLYVVWSFGDVVDSERPKRNAISNHPSLRSGARRRNAGMACVVPLPDTERESISDKIQNEST